MDRIPHIDALRGFAALAVCWYHMTHGGDLLGGGFASCASSYCFLGVEVFFVISGFVIPHSMRGINYNFRRAGEFFLKRALRVHPPFLAASVMAILLNLLSSLSPGYAGTIGQDYVADAATSLLLDATYLTGILGRSWILVVAWTLAIEVQFYILVGLVFPLIENCGPWKRAMALPLLASSAWLLPDTRFITAYLPYFALGWAGVDLRLQITRPALVGAILVAFAILFTCPFSGTIAATSGLVFIVFWKKPTRRLFTTLGSISYSLYLIHVPIGGKVINLLDRILVKGWPMAVAAILATLMSVGAAWMFWKLFEVPFHRISRNIHFSSRNPTRLDL